MNPSSGRANRRILIVDDTASIHEDFRKILCADTNGSQSLDSIEETLFGTAPPCARPLHWTPPTRARKRWPW